MTQHSEVVSNHNREVVIIHNSDVIIIHNNEIITIQNNEVITMQSSAQSSAGMPEHISGYQKSTCGNSSTGTKIWQHLFDKHVFCV